MDATPEDAPFPLGSVQAVTSRAWELCLREDPVGLLLIPFIITFPVSVFLTIAGEIYRSLLPGPFARVPPTPPDPALLGAVFGVMPLVAFAFVFGEAWMLWRSDAEAHGRRVGLGETARHAFSRTWYLVVVVLARYALFQLGSFFFVLPGLLVAIGASFSTQAAVLGPGKLIASLRQSWDLVEHNIGAYFGMVAYWGIVFVGLGILVTIVRVSLRGAFGGEPGFIFDLALWLPLQAALLVLATCWTLFYRELEARRHLRLAVPHPVDVSARAS